MSNDLNVNAEEVNTDSVTDVEISQLIPNVIDNVLITIDDNHHTLFLPLNFNGLQFKNWKKTRGAVFSKDVLNYSLQKPTGKYIVIKSKDLNCIARIIDENEKLNFEVLKLIDGTIKDRPYTIIKNIENGEIISSFKPLIEKDTEKDSIIILVDTPIIYMGSPKISPEEDVDHHTGSISLFNE